MSKESVIPLEKKEILWEGREAAYRTVVSKCNVHTDHLGIFSKLGSDSGSLGWGLRVCIFNISGVVAVVAPWATMWVAKVNRIWNYCCCCLVAKACPTLHNPMDCGVPGFPFPHHFLDFAQVHVHSTGDAIQLTHPLLPSPSALSFQHQGLFQRVGSLHQVAKVLKLQLQHQSFQWVFMVDFI